MLVNDPGSYHLVHGRVFVPACMAPLLRSRTLSGPGYCLPAIPELPGDPPVNKRIYIALAIIVAGVSFFLFNFVYTEAENTAITKLNEDQMIHAKQAARGIEDFFARWTQSLDSLSKLDAVVDNDAVGKRYMRLFYEANEGRIKSIIRMDERGTIRYTVPASRAAGTDISDQKHVRELLRERKPVISDVFRAVEGFDSIALHVPVFRGAEFKGSIGLLIDFESLAKRYLDVVKIGGTGYAWVVSRDGALLYSPVPGTTGRSVFEIIKDFPSLNAMVSDMLKGREGTATYTFDRIGSRIVGQTTKYAVYVPVRIGNTFWSIAVASAEEDVLSGLVSFRNKLVLVIGALFICGMSLSTLGAKAWVIVKEEEKRRQVEKQLEDRLRFEKVLTGISTKFINVSIDRLDDEIKAAQRQICQYLGADICTLWQFSPDRPGNLVMTHIHVSPDVPFEAPETIDAKESFPWCLEMVMRKRTIVLPRITDAPAAAVRDLDTWKSYGIRSALTFPLFAGDDSSFGALGFNTLKEEHDWPEELVNRLHIVSQVFASALNRKFIERNLRESETRLRLAAASANAGLWSWDYRTGNIWGAGNTRSLYGFSPDEEITADRFFSTLHPDDLERVRLVAERVFRAGTAVQIEYRIVLPDKSIKWIAVRAQAFLNAAGEPGTMTGVSVDITERKLAEKALEESQAQIAAVMDSTGDFVWSVDPERFGLLTWNKSFSDYFFDQRGIKLEVGMTPSELVPPDYVVLWHELFSRALREGSFSTEYVVVARTKVLLLSFDLLKRGGEVFGISIFGKDITDRKRAEEELRRSEERFRQIVESVSDFIWEVDAEGLYRYTSPAVKNILGYTSDELVGKMHFYDLFAPEVREELKAAAFKIFAVKESFRAFPNANINKAGQIVHLETSGVPMLDEAGNLVGYRGSDRDMTERKRAVSALLASEERFRALAESALVGIYVLQDGKYAYVNPAMARVFGYSVAEMTGMSPREIVHPDDYGMVGENIKRRITGEVQAIQYEVRGRHKDGSTRDVEVYGTRVVMNSRPALVGTLIDITDRKRAEEALRETEQRFRRMADSAPVLIWMSGTDKLCTYFNQQWLVFTGRTLEEELGNGWAEGVHPEDYERCLAVYTAAFDRREPFSIEYRLRRTDGEYRWIYDTGIPHISPSGDFLGYIGSCIDITWHKQAEEALKESEASLRSSQKDLKRLAGKLISAQEDELRRLSRELHDDLTQRLAVTAIEAGKLELELNKMPHVPPDPVQKISRIKEQLIKVSEDVHRISRQLHPTILDDLGLVRAIESECAAFMRRENIEIIFREEDVPEVIANDIALCLYRVVQEGLRNVAAHSGAKNCEIVLKRVDNTLCLAVSDDGAGFDPGEVRQKPGLGLSSMRERAQLVQADFSIKSRPGQGAVIQVCVPLTGGDA